MEPSSFRRALAGAGVMLALGLAAGALFAPSAWGGRLVATGHDADLHCSGGQQCHYLKVAVDYVRKGAPDPSKRVLLLGPKGGDLERALDAAFPPAGSVPRDVVVPRTGFAGVDLSTSRYSAMLVSSDTTCGGCDLNASSATPDSDAINARKADVESFFNAGGGILALAGSDHGDGSAASDTYYSFLPLPVGGVAVSPPFTLTAEGKALGFEDSTNGVGTNDDVNCCPTHNSFALPAAGSELKVAETDGKGLAETLFAEGRISDGTIVKPPPATDPNERVKPADVIKLPPARRCVSRRVFRIRLRRPKGVTLLAARVSVNGKGVPVVVKTERRVRKGRKTVTRRGKGRRFKRNISRRFLRQKRLTAEVDLRGLPKGRFNVEIRAVTKTLKILRGTRRYRTCTRKLKGGPPKL